MPPLQWTGTAQNAIMTVGTRVHISAVGQGVAMQSTSEVVFQAAMQLPEGERLVLVSRLLEMTPAEDAGVCLDDASLLDELDRRFSDGESCVEWPELRAGG
jgi:hypothetical protein